MKRILLSFVGGVALSFGTFAQQSGWCGTDQKLNEWLNGDPQKIEQFHQDMMNAASFSGNVTKVTKTIPVVFHILYDSPFGNISEAQIQSALDVLNADLNRLNSDASSTRNIPGTAPFAPQAGSMDIQFKLAKIDPNGNCTNGIIRKQVAPNITNEADQSSEPHKHTANGGSDAWPRNKYFNIWVVNSIGVSSGGGIILGYAQFPTWGSADEYGLTMRNDYTGTVGTAAGGDGRTLTHEVGHCLGLLHIFQGGCGNSGSCSGQGDYCCDTPPQADADYTCNQTLNTCSQVPSGDPYGVNVYDQIENYMSYNSCTNMFSMDQVNIMEGNFSSISWMTNLASASNATATGINLPDILCQADFSADKTTVCSGSQIQFTDNSYSVATGWEWEFIGGNPSMSSSQNPLITYSTPGTYQVKLISNDGSNFDTEIKTAYIKVLPPAVSLPFLEGFESYSSLNNLTEWEIINPNGNGFVLGTTGLNSAQSAKLTNYGQAAGDVDELVSSPVDLSGVSQVTLSFRYAHKRRNTSDDDQLKIYLTSNCGDSWSLRKTILFSSVSAVQGTSFTPSSSNDWTTVHMTNVTSSFWVDNFRYKFSFSGGGGNNFYLDNINIYEGAPSDDLVDGTAEVVENIGINGLSVYPNPVEDELSVDFTIANAQEVILLVQDISGKIVQQHKINANEGSNLVLMDTQKLSSGVYFIEVKSTGTRQTRQFVVK